MRICNTGPARRLSEYDGVYTIDRDTVLYIHKEIGFRRFWFHTEGTEWHEPLPHYQAICLEIDYEGVKEFGRRVRYFVDLVLPDPKHTVLLHNGVVEEECRMTCQAAVNLFGLPIEEATVGPKPRN